MVLYSPVLLLLLSRHCLACLATSEICGLRLRLLELLHEGAAGLGLASRTAAPRWALGEKRWGIQIR